MASIFSQIKQYKQSLSPSTWTQISLIIFFSYHLSNRTLSTFFFIAVLNYYCTSIIITFLFLVSRPAYEASVLSCNKNTTVQQQLSVFLQGAVFWSCFWACTCTDWLMIVSPASPGLCSGVLLWPPCPCCIIQQQPDTVVHHSQIQCSRRLFVSGIVLWTAVLCMNLIYMTVYSQY